MKILRVLFIGVVILAWNVDLPALSQQKTSEGRATAIFAAANGAALGAFSVGFIRYHATWYRLCSSMRDRGYSLQGFVDLVVQHVKQYPWEEHLRMILGPAIGATAGLVLASQMQGLAGGNTPMAPLGGVVGLGMGLGLACLTARLPRSHDEWVALELISIAEILGFTALATGAFYYPQIHRSSSRTSRHPTSLVPTMTVTFWSLRF